jgi:hypothetical protein
MLGSCTIASTHCARTLQYIRSNNDLQPLLGCDEAMLEPFEFLFVG